MHESTSNNHVGEQGHLKEELKERARQAAGQAQSAAESGKDRVVEAAGGVARSLHRVSDELRSEDQAEVARYTERVAAKIEQLADALQSRDLPSIAQDVKRLAQRQPALFLGGAFTAGLIAARFFKSSAAGAAESSNRTSAGFDAAVPQGSQAADADDYGPAQGGYGPASSPAAGMGGNGNFGSEGTGGDAAGDLDAANGSPFAREK
jgi:hypothetical protein